MTLRETMQPDRSRWTIVGLLFVTLFFVMGPVNAGGVFFLPVVNTFGWSRAQFAALGAIVVITAGVLGPLVGWLIDRAGLRTMMIGGTIALVFCDLALSHANSFAQFAAICIVAGAAYTATTFIPCSIVIANWFAAERGLAMGLVFMGIPLGGTGMTIVANYIVQHFGWRIGYLAMGLPLAAIVIPALFLHLRQRPSAAIGADPAAASGGEPEILIPPGLDLREALQSRSFWMIGLVGLMLNTSWIGVGAHFIPYLIGAGYTAGAAAAILSVGFVLSAAGSSIAGLFADRLNGRTAMALVCACAAAGIGALFAAARGWALVACLVLFWAVTVTPAVLTPLLIAESLGLRHLGAIMGIEGIFSTIGYAAGPIIAGRIYDVTGSYSSALWVFIACSLAAGLAILGCRPLAEEQSRRAAAAEVSAA